MFHQIYSICVLYILNSQEMIVLKTPKEPKKSAAEGGRLLRQLFCLLYNHFLEVQNIICRYSVYLMEHICFEAQLCMNMAMFTEKSNIDIVINLCLGTSLLYIGPGLR